MHHILCESPFISRDFYAIRPLILWHILGSHVLLTWGVGVVKIVFRTLLKCDRVMDATPSGATQVQQKSGSPSHFGRAFFVFMRFSPEILSKNGKKKHLLKFGGFLEGKVPTGHKNLTISLVLRICLRKCA